MSTGLRSCLLPALVVALVLSGCGSFPRNQQLARFDADTGYRLDELALQDNNTDSLFVVVTFSGGGTRAAALSYGVMEQLRGTEITWKGVRKTLLDEVDIVSSVSGGSFTAAYYALNREALFDGSFETGFLKKDIQGALIKSLFNPANLLKVAGRSYGRSDLAAQYYDDNLFAGATYRQLIENGTRPFFMINATDMSAGLPFPFIQDQFDLLCSDLAELPVARAVAASSAFPGLMTPLTLENYGGTCQYEEPVWVGEALNDGRIAPERDNLAQAERSFYAPNPWELTREYVHLMDGGVSDNIGLRNVIRALETSDPRYSIQTRINNEEIEKLVVIVVNAATAVQSRRDASARVPGLFDVLSTAATVPMSNYSFDTVERLRNVVGAYNRDVATINQCQALIDQACPAVVIPGGDLYQFDLYLAQVAFDFIADPARRFEFRNLPTNFSLPAHTVDALRGVGKELLQLDPQFQQLVNDLGQ